jgi:glycosyltransferase involved in cell wall biosynthesis
VYERKKRFAYLQMELALQNESVQNKLINCYNQNITNHTMKIAHISVAEQFTAMWINSQVSQGHDVHLITLQPDIEVLKGATIHKLPFGKPFGYYLNALHVRHILKKIKPDILHVHYASGHGTLGRLSGFHPSILSVWGSDVMVTPNESPRMRKTIQKNLRNYDWICSTSHVMAKSVWDLCPGIKKLSITPIGVETTLFASDPIQRHDSESIVVGTIKTMHPIYGVDILIRAFALARENIKQHDERTAHKLKLLLVGSGPQTDVLKALASQLGLSASVEFPGRVPHDTVPLFMNKIDIFVAMSRVESFGVAVVEASACERPVIVSNVGGLPEVVRHEKTGFIIEPESVAGCAEAIVKLVFDENLRREMGRAGRRFVQENYEWNHCLGLMSEIYEKTLLAAKR